MPAYRCSSNEIACFSLNRMYLVAEPVRLVLEVFGTYDKRRLSADMAQKRPKFDGFTLMKENHVLM